MAHCEDNLKDIYQALLRYRQEYGQVMPETLEVLAEMKYITLWTLVCPANHYPIGESSYLFCPLVWPTRPTNRLVLVYDRDPVHKDRRNILFADGSLQRLPEGIFQRALKENALEREVLSLKTHK